MTNREPERLTSWKIEAGKRERGLNFGGTSRGFAKVGHFPAYRALKDTQTHTWRHKSREREFMSPVEEEVTESGREKSLSEKKENEKLEKLSLLLLAQVL